jgi:hypothetical protein
MPAAVLEVRLGRLFDVQKFFDEVPWHLVLKAVRAVTDCRRVLLYVERWLKAPVQHGEKRAGRSCRGAEVPGPVQPSGPGGRVGGDDWLAVLVEELERVGAEVHLAEPAEAAALKGKKKRAKTDWAEARHLRGAAVDRPAAGVVDPAGAPP